MCPRLVLRIIVIPFNLLFVASVLKNEDLFIYFETQTFLDVKSSLISRA